VLDPEGAVVGEERAAGEEARRALEEAAHGESVPGGPAETAHTIAPDPIV
jgi:hypothetical protein